MISNILTYIVFLAIAYILTKYWVFKNGEKDLGVFIRFVIGRGIMLGVNSIMLYVDVSIFKMKESIAQLITTCAVFLLSYTMNKYIFKTVEK